MKSVIVFVLVLVVAIGALGYWRGWFTTTTNGKTDLEVNKKKIEEDKTAFAKKFKEDKTAFSKSVGDKAHVLKEKVEGLWKKSDTLTGEEKTHAQKELAELKAQHEKLEKQIKDLDDAAPEKFESLKEDLTKSLDAVEKKIEDLTKKLEKKTAP